MKLLIINYSESKYLHLLLKKIEKYDLKIIKTDTIKEFKKHTKDPYYYYYNRYQRCHIYDGIIKKTCGVPLYTLHQIVEHEDGTI